MKKITFEITDDAYEVLKLKQIEFRGELTELEYKQLRLVYQLKRHGLVRRDLDAYHQTYKITDFGRKALEALKDTNS
jgi:predicted transcriptional regulator